MRLISADFNAMTEAGHVRLTLPCSQEGIQRLELGAGDWAWLSDSELIVGAQLAIDDRYGLVGVPDWDTLVHLDDEDAEDIDHSRREIATLLTKVPHSDGDEPRVFQLLTVLEHVAPLRTDGPPVTLGFRRAVALRQMGKLRLALLEAEDARHERPGDPIVDFLYLDLLRLEDLPSAVAEAEAILESPTVPALVLSGCINILATQAEQTPDADFTSMAERVLGLCRRFDQAPDVDQVGNPLAALSYFNRGFVLLRAGQISKARQAFDRAVQIYPDGPMVDAVTGLQTYDRRAREVAQRVRTIAERWVPPMTVAA